MSPTCSDAAGFVHRQAQLRAHPRRELGERERLDQVVDGARVEAGDAILDLTARGEHEHRDRHLCLA